MQSDAIEIAREMREMELGLQPKPVNWDKKTDFSFLTAPKDPEEEMSKSFRRGVNWRQREMLYRQAKERVAERRRRELLRQIADEDSKQSEDGH